MTQLVAEREVESGGLKMPERLKELLLEIDPVLRIHQRCHPGMLTSQEGVKVRAREGSNLFSGHYRSEIRRRISVSEGAGAKKCPSISVPKRPTLACTVASSPTRVMEAFTLELKKLSASP